MNELLLSCIIFLIGVMLITSWKNENQEGGKNDQNDDTCTAHETCDMSKATLVGNNCGTYNYLKNEEDCPGNDMLTRDHYGNLIPIEYNKNSPGINCCNLLSKCEELCSKHKNCVGFSYNGNRCPLKTARCENGVKNGYQFYKKPGAPDSMPNIIPPYRPPPPRVNYQKFSRDCPGNDINFFSNMSLDQCKQRCSENPRCRGVSYHPANRICYTKYDICPYPGTTANGFNFHKKY